MKRGIKTLAFLLLVLAGVCCIRGTRSQAKAKLIELNPNRPYLNYDVTMNGKKDRVEVLSKTKDDLNTLRIRINGKVVYKDKLFSASPDVQVIRLQKKQTLLYVGHPGEDDYGPREIYSYKGAKWKRLLAFGSEEIGDGGSAEYGGLDSASKDTVTVCYKNLSGMIGAISYYMTYRYQNNELVRLSPVTDVYINKLSSSAFKKNTHLTAKQSIVVYDGTAEAGTIVATINPGDDVLFRKIQPGIEPRWFEVTVGDVTGWIPEMEYKSDGNGGGYYFEDVGFYG